MICEYCGRELSHVIGRLHVTNMEAFVVMYSGDKPLHITDKYFCDSRCLTDMINELICACVHDEVCGGK